MYNREFLLLGACHSMVLSPCQKGWVIWPIMQYPFSTAYAGRSIYAIWWYFKISVKAPSNCAILTCIRWHQCDDSTAGWYRIYYLYIIGFECLFFVVLVYHEKGRETLTHDSQRSPWVVIKHSGCESCVLWLLPQLLCHCSLLIVSLETTSISWLLTIFGTVYIQQSHWNYFNSFLSIITFPTSRSTMGCHWCKTFC